MCMEAIEYRSINRFSWYLGKNEQQTRKQKKAKKNWFRNLISKNDARVEYLICE